LTTASRQFCQYVTDAIPWVMSSPHLVRGSTTIDTATATRTVATNGGNNRLNVFTHRSAKNGIRPRSVRRTKELVIK
ncbi:Hypothetical protein PROPJV5_2580, partial [Propionibacterium ruminifibrarum]